MGLPRDPVTLNPDAVAALYRELSDLRHDVNNHLSLMVTALELIRRQPDAVPRVWQSLAERPQRILDDIRKYSVALEQALHISQD